MFAGPLPYKLKRNPMSNPLDKIQEVSVWWSESLARLTATQESPEESYSLKKDITNKLWDKVRNIKEKEDMSEASTPYLWIHIKVPKPRYMEPYTIHQVMANEEEQS